VPDYKYGKPGSEKHHSQPTLPTNHTLQYCSKYGVPEKTQISPTFVNPMLHLISCRNKKVSSQITTLAKLIRYNEILCRLHSYHNQRTTNGTHNAAELSLLSDHPEVQW